MVFVYTAMGVLCVEHANVLELCYIELLSGDGSPYSLLSDIMWKFSHYNFSCTRPCTYTLALDRSQ